jgi:hypothetical protein
MKGEERNIEGIATHVIDEHVTLPLMSSPYAIAAAVGSMMKVLGYLGHHFDESQTSCAFHPVLICALASAASANYLASSSQHSHRKPIRT